MPIQQITTGIIADGAVVATDIANGTVTGPKLGANSVSSNNIVSVLGSAITSNTVANSAFQTGSVENYSRATGLLSGMRNRIINGAMVIDQRNAGASVTPSSGVNTYLVDRWSVYPTQASKLTAQQNAGSVTPPAGFTNYQGITSSSAYSVVSGDFFIFRQFIEGFNSADLGWGTANAKTVTLSFWVRSSLTGTFAGSLYNYDGTRSYPFTYSIPVANTWTQISVTIAGDTSGTWLTTNGVGITVSFSLGSGSTYSGTAGAWSGSFLTSATGATSVVGTNGATFYITGVQLEVGSTATSFDYRPYGTELALCQRYYYKFVVNNGSGTAWFGVATTALSSVRSIGIPLTLPVSARTTPSLSFSQFSLVNALVNTSYAVTSASVYAGYSIYGTAFSLDMTTSGISAGTLYFLYVADGGFLAYSMEL